MTCLRCFFLSSLSLFLGNGHLLTSGPPEPLFSRHVVPVLSKLGCNAGACHGMVQGKGGFRLSLFGVDPILDHERLLRRIERPARQPCQS